MPLERFLEWYPRYRDAAADPAGQDVYHFLASPRSVWAMKQASLEDKPALNGVVRELEDKFDGRFDFDNPVNRRMVGSMIKEIIYDFGFRRAGQRMVSNSRYFSTASYYHYHELKGQKKILNRYAVADDDGEKDEFKEELSETTPGDNGGTYAEDGLELAVGALTRAGSQVDRHGLSLIVNSFIQLLRHDEPKTRTLAAKALGEMGASASGVAGQALVEALRDEEAMVRQDAARALGQMGPAAFQVGAEALADAMQDEDEEVGEIAATALGKWGMDGIGKLLELIEHPRGHVRTRAATALGKAGVLADGDAAAGLLNALKSGDAELKTAAAWALGSTGANTPGVHEALQQALQDENSRVREKAAWALGKIGAATASPGTAGLRETLEDKDPLARRTTAWALGQMGQRSHSSVPSLILLLQDEDRMVREKAAWALGRIIPGSPHGTPAVPPLINALSDVDWGVRRAAAQALGRIGPAARNARTALEELQAKPAERELVKDAARRAIGEIEK